MYTYIIATYYHNQFHRGHAEDIIYASVSLAVYALLQEGFDGQMTEDNIEIGICNADGFKKLEPSEVKDYLAAIL